MDLMLLQTSVHPNSYPSAAQPADEHPRRPLAVVQGSSSEPIFRLNLVSSGSIHWRYYRHS